MALQFRSLTRQASIFGAKTNLVTGISMKKCVDVPVLLLHGWGGSFQSTWVDNQWVRIFENAGRQVIQLDLPGHGSDQASKVPEDYADLACLLNSRLPEDMMFDAVGYSLGGKLLLALAIAEPHRFRRLVVGGLGGNIFQPETAGIALAAALEFGITSTTPPGIERLVNYAIQAGNDPASVAAVIKRPPNPIILPEQLRSITQPTLLMYGDKDDIALPVELLAASLPHAQQIILEGVSHLGLPADPSFREQAFNFLMQAIDDN